MADCARLLGTRVIPSEGLIPFLAGRLIALDKKLEVRPIGVGQVLRRTVAKAALCVAAPEIEKACRCIQKCAGKLAGIKTAVHAVHQIYNDEETDGVLLVDARNAFNRLNREAAPHNVQRLCPALSNVIMNSYETAAHIICCR